MKARIVRFNDGLYGVRQWFWPCGYKFLGKDGNNWWATPSYISDYCHFELYVAQNLLEFGATKHDKGVPV